MFAPPDEDSQTRRKIRESKIKAFFDMNVTPANMMFTCKKYGLDVPKKTDYYEFDLWLTEYLGKLSDDEIIELMKKLGLTIVVAPNKWSGVFIIHSGKDEVYAKAITKSLNCIGIPDTSIYCSSIDETGTSIGESFFDIIKKCLCNARLVICLLSRYSVESKYCMQEVGASIIQDLPIIPVLLRDFDPENMPGFLDNTRYQVAFISNESKSRTFLREVTKRMELVCSSVDLERGVQVLVLGED